MGRAGVGRIAAALAGAGWVVAVGAGLAALHAYEARPGSEGAPGRDWPAGTAIPLDARRANLVMLAHPFCPCTRASLEQLAGVMERHGGGVSAHVAFFAPAGSRGGWAPRG